MRRISAMLLAGAAIAALSGCVGYVDHGGRYGYYDGYYDGYYGPYSGGYWASDGYFYYMDQQHVYRRDDSRHFRHERFDGGQRIQAEHRDDRDHDGRYRDDHDRD